MGNRGDRPHSSTFFLAILNSLLFVNSCLLLKILSLTQNRGAMAVNSVRNGVWFTLGNPYGSFFLAFYLCAHRRLGFSRRSDGAPVHLH